MRWDMKGWRDGFLARKTTGLTAYIRRVRPPEQQITPECVSGGGPGYDVNYSGVAIARIYFENKGATVKALETARAFPEISDLDLVEIALRLSKLREAAAAALN